MILRSANDSETRGRRPSAFSVAFCSVLLSLSLLLPHAFSQEGDPPLIGSVQVWVDNLPPNENIERLISIKQGDAYSLEAITQDIKRIHKTGLFSDVEVLKSGQEQVELKFMLTRKLLVRKIHFKGNIAISRARLDEALFSLRPDSFFSEEKLSRATEELKKGLNQQGYFLPKIEPAVRRDSRAPEVDVTFAIRPGKRFTVEDVLFAGNGPVSKEALQKKMKTRKGSPYIPARLEQDIASLKNLYATLSYPRAEIELVNEKFDTARERVALYLNIDLYERIKIIIQGATVPVKLLTPIWQERIFEDWGLTEGEARIVSYLREKGFIFASVSSHVERTDSEIRVVHDVSPGRKTKIRDIRFEGISYFTAEQIKQQMGISDRFLFFEVIGGKRLFELPGEIENLYESKGFADVNVDLQFVPKGSAVTAEFLIKEGEQQRIDGIVIRGATLFDPKTLLAEISIAAGGPYFPPDIQRAIQKLETFYLNQAVRGTAIQSKTEAVGDNRFRVTLEIQEGRIMNIQNLVVTGNLVTTSKTVARELRIKEGDQANYDEIMASKRNLERLGVFTEVKVEEIPLSANAENVIITLREGQRNFVSAGLGLETRNVPFVSSPTSINDLSLMVVADYMRNNVFGRAANLSFVSQFSLAEKRLVLNWEQPYFFFGYPIKTYVNAWYEQEDRVSFSYRREGVSLTGIRPIPRDLLLIITLKYAKTSTFLEPEATPEQIGRVFLPYSTSSLAPSFVRERRNDVFNPAKGYFASLGLEWAFPLFDTQSDFLKGVIKYQRFFPLASRVDLGSTFRLGLGMGKMAIPERFFAGGSNTFRGAELDMLGPKSPVTGVPVGGKLLLLFNFDLTFPLISSLKDLSGVIFYDLGNVFYNRSDFTLRELQSAAGLGLRYRTPLGPLRFELGWNLSDPPANGAPIIFVTIGNVF